MANSSNISRPIIDALYADALALSEQVRQTFDISPLRRVHRESDQVRLALSVEGLRTTTRIMHVLAWLLNFRAYLDGELSELNLRRHSRLPKDHPAEDSNLACLELPTRDLIRQTEQLHARIARLDKSWREAFHMEPSAVHRLRHRIGASFN